MSDDKSDEPQFARVFVPNWLQTRGHWVAEFDRPPGGFHVKVVEEKERAKIFISPTAEDLEDIRFTLGMPVQVIDATFAEWVEAGGSSL